MAKDETFSGRIMRMEQRVMDTLAEKEQLRIERDRDAQFSEHWKWAQVRNALDGSSDGEA